MARLARPVWRAAIIPTFLPGGVLRPTVVGLPACLCRPPPCGCEAEIIFCPETVGQNRPRVFISFHTVPAFRNGFSVLPPRPLRQPLLDTGRSCTAIFQMEAVAPCPVECELQPYNTFLTTWLDDRHRRDAVLH